MERNRRYIDERYFRLNKIMQTNFNSISSEQLNNIALKLMDKAGIIAKGLKCQRILRGRNNKVFRIDSDKKTFFLKHYFQSPEDTRDRLESEFSFVSFCNEKNIERVPIALACHKKNGFALYSWIEGKSFTKVANEKQINEAISFLKELAQYSTNEVKSIKPASDAYFFLSDHLKSLELRIKNLQENFVPQDTALAQKAFTLLEKNIIPQYQYLAQELKEFCINADRQYVDNFILSPSDFGFHNALDTSNGLVFLDFEYAGIDGPVKTLCDFVCQPDFPVHKSYLAVLAKTIYIDAEKAQQLLLRTQKILPICRLKWCCIMLNHFTKIGVARRNFANDADIQKQQIKQAHQIKKVQDYMKLHLTKI